MSITDRPYAGTWLANRTLVRYTPDCLVYVNGYTDMPGCPTCKRSINLQKFITTVSVETSTDPISTATVSLQVPKHAVEAFGYDGNWLLQPGLEIIIHFRGYFPQRLPLREGEGIQGPLEEGDLDPSTVPLYPYYQVFRGVVTDVSHEYSGGFYSATLTCADMLHFWQNLYLSTNGSVFGTRPKDSGVTPNLLGHKLTGMSPFSIMYTLVRAGFGAAYGVEFKLGLKTNIDDAGGAHLIKHAAQWWENRWNESAGNLRMYGMDGSVFNEFAQAYLGVFQAGQDAANNIVKSLTNKTSKTSKNLDGHHSFLDTARKLGYDPTATQAGVGNNLASQNMLKMQTYALDFGTLANPSMFGSEYMSKLEIANAVKAITGYEFYQDVDGDIVFKPPFYNLDTSSDPVFVMEDRDIISISETSKEPEATMIKGSGLVFESTKGTGVDDWTGKGATYIDYKLVAQFGWKEAGAFETHYLSNPQAIFVSAINRLDMANVGMNTVSITIPLRPELRAGYPIYIRHLDCFYYLKSVFHSFTFGGGCTSSLQGIARRRKFLPPGEAPTDGNPPTLDNVKLGEPGKYPALPLYVYPQNVGDGSAATAGPPRIVGFPNVVFALDADKIDVGAVPNMPISDHDLESLVFTARSLGRLHDAPDQIDASGAPQYRLSRDSAGRGQLVTREDLRAAFTEARNALVEHRLVADGALNSAAAMVLRQSELGQEAAIQDEMALQSRMSLLVNAKALFAPGMSQAGQYRYFSSSHATPEDQGPYNLEFTDTGIKRVPGTPDDTRDIPTLVNAIGKGIGVQMCAPVRGISIATAETVGGKTLVKPHTILTGDLRYVAFAQHSNQLPTTASVAEDGAGYGQALGFLPSKLTSAIKSFLYVSATRTSPSQTIHQRFDYVYRTLQEALTILYDEVLTVFPDISGRRLKGESYVSVRFDLLSLNSTVGLKFDPDVTVTSIKKYTNQDSLGMDAIASYLASVNCKFIVSLMAAATILAGDHTLVLKPVYNARDTFFRKVGQSLRLGTPLPKTKAVSVSKTKQKNEPFYTPVFPVSDQNGYEVYGGLPYGRGLDLIKHYEITLASKGADNDMSVGAGLPTSLSSMEAIERFYVAYQNNNFNVSGALAALGNASQAAAVAASLNVHSNDRSIQVRGIEEALARMTQEDANRVVRAHNTPVDSSSRGMSFSGRAAAQNLAGLHAGGEGACTCKGADGSFYLQAFSGEFAEHEQGDVQGWLQDQARLSGEGWAASRAAIAGQVLDLRNKTLSQAWNQAKNRISDSAQIADTKADAELDKIRELARREKK